MDFELVGVPLGSALTTADLELVLPDGRGATSTPPDRKRIRVLPSDPADAAVVDVDPLTSEAYAAVDRTLAEHENDILLTMAHAPNVTAILTPDAPGTYVVLVTVADACNATASALTNATAMCSHRPVAAVTNETDGVRPWDQKLAMAHVSEKYAFGWWPAHALDASATASDPADEADYFESRRAFDARLAGEAMFEEDQEGGQGIPVPIIVVNNNNAPQPSPPPPPTNRPLYALEEWTEWTSAPTWDAPFHEGDGLLYEWTLTDAPHGSNAWRRFFRLEGEAEVPALADASGHAYLHATAPEGDAAPTVTNERNVLASFAPDVVGTYGFRLDVSNACAKSTVRFAATFACNAAPQPSFEVVVEDVGMCLAKRTIVSTANDTDGDAIATLWNRGGGGAAAAAAAAAEREEEDASGGSGANATAASDADASDGSPPGTDADGLELVFADGSPTGAGAASLGLLLDASVGDVTSFTPDAPGRYDLVMTVTDGRTARALARSVRVEWEAHCEASARTAASAATAVPVAFLCAAILAACALAFGAPTHPYDPLVLRDVARRLRRWEATKKRVKFDRLRDRWEVKRQREALESAVGEVVRRTKRQRRGGVSEPGEGPGTSDEYATPHAPGGDARSSSSGRKKMSRRVSLRFAAAAQRRFASAVATLAGSTEDQAELVPPSTHVWRVARFLGIFAEGVTLASAAFGRNAAPFWGASTVAVGRAFGLQADAPALYDAIRLGAAATAFSAVCTQFERVPKGAELPVVRRAFAALRSARVERSRRRARREPKEFAFAVAGPGGPGKNERAAATSVSRPRAESKSKSNRAYLPPSDERSAEAAADRERTEARRRFEEASRSGPLGVVARFVSRLVGACSMALGFALAEPLFVPLASNAAAAFTCNHLDVHRPFPHLARDDTLRCYGSEHRSLMLLASFILVVAPCLALRFALRVAPALDATVSEAPHFAVARVALRWFAAVHSIVRGEADMTRVEPRGAYGAPSGAFADLGYPRTLHLRNDRDHLLGLWFACVALYAWNFHFQPARGKGGRVNEARGGAYAGAAFVAFVGYLIACDRPEPVDGGEVDRATARARLACALLFLPAAFYLGYTHTAERAELFAFPDQSPREMRRHDDPRVRAMGVLISDETDGLVGYKGHWEGLQRQWREERRKREAGETALVTRGVNYELGGGLETLTADARDDVAEDAAMWQLVLQTHFAGLRVGAHVRVHACEAVSALATTCGGVLVAQRACLAPLVRRLMLDPDSGAVRRAACDAAAALARNAARRGASVSSG